jgi:hypothetical protein
MFWFFKLDYPVLADRACVSLALIFSEPLVIYIMYYLFTHSFVAPLGRIHIGLALLDFLEKYAKWHLYATVEFHSIFTYLEGVNSICMDSKGLLNIFCKL